ncbi:hypothetical protein STEG23_018416 [Scotinomys teguina]
MIFRSLLEQQLTKLWKGRGTGIKEKTAENFIINVKVKDRMADAEQAFEDAAGEEALTSPQVSDALDDNSSPSTEEDEEIELEREIEAIRRKLKRSSPKERPPARNPLGGWPNPFGSLSVVCTLWILLHQSQTETYWVFMKNPQLLMPAGINSPVRPATVSTNVSTSTAAIQIDTAEGNINPWLVADFQSNATDASAIEIAEHLGPH